MGLYLKNCFIWGAKYQSKNITAAVPKTAMARSGLVRKVTLAMASRLMAMTIFSKASSQLNNSFVIFCNVLNGLPWVLEEEKQVLL